MGNIDIVTAISILKTNDCPMEQSFVSLLRVCFYSYTAK